MSPMKSTRRNTSITAVALAAFVGTALAAAPDSTASLLGGPEVVASDAPGAQVAMDGTRITEQGSRATPIRAYIQAIRGLNGPNADEGLALSDEQREQVRSAAQEYGAQLKEYLKGHKEEIDEIRALGAGDAIGRLLGDRERGANARRGQGAEGERRARPDRPEAGQADAPLPGEEIMFDDLDQRPDPETRRAGMEKIRTLMENAPSDQDAKAKIWSVLNADQQAFVQSKIDSQMAEREARIAEMAAGGNAKGKRSKGAEQDED